jgi:hypothetical protein
MRNDVGMVVHDQRSIAAHPESEHEIGQRKWCVKRQQIVIGDPAPQPQWIGRRTGQRPSNAERAHALDRDAVHEDAPLPA